MTATPLPRWLWIPAGAAVVVLVVPVLAMVSRVPWSRVPGLLSAAPAQDALRLSLITSLSSTVASVVLGLPLALLLSRARGRVATAGRVLAALPMVLPPVVAGLALQVALGRRTWLGSLLSSAGVDLAFTTSAVVVAQTFVAMPFLVVAVEGALRSSRGEYEAVASTLGASPTTVLRRVTLPLVAPALASGAALSFARSLGEFGATITFAGSLQGTTRTLPLAIYLERESDTDTALALALLLIAIATAVLAAAAWLPHARRSGR